MDFLTTLQLMTEAKLNFLQKYKALIKVEEKSKNKQMYRKWLNTAEANAEMLADEKGIKEQSPEYNAFIIKTTEKELKAILKREGINATVLVNNPRLAESKTYTDHWAVRCDSCGHPLDGQPKENEDGYKQKCNACGKTTSYQLKESITTKDLLNKVEDGEKLSASELNVLVNAGLITKDGKPTKKAKEIYPELFESLKKDSDGNYRDKDNNVYNDAHAEHMKDWKYALVDTGTGVTVLPREKCKGKAILGVFDNEKSAMDAKKYSNKR